MKYLLGVDIGTYSSKGVLLSTDGAVTARASVEHGMVLPQVGRAEHDAEETWWGDFVGICHALLSGPGASGCTVQPTEIAAVGVSGIAPCVLPVGRDGRPLRNAILYGVDTRATAEIAALNDELGLEWIRAHAGTDLDSQSAGPKILWIRNHEPEVWARTRTIMTASSYLGYRLTGVTAIDHYTAAFYAPLYDLGARNWNDHACDVIMEGRRLPDLCWPTDVIGTVQREAAEAAGLAANTPVVAGTADAAAEAIGAGVSRRGDAMLMIGSSIFIIAWTATLPGDGLFWSAPGLEPTSMAVAAGMATAGSLTRWFRDQFGTADDDYETLMEEARRVPAGSGGLLALPYFSGERTPVSDPHARGVVVGLTLNHTRGHLYRSLLESIAFGTRHNLDLLADRGIPTDALTAIGGGTLNPLWMQIFSDVLKTDVQVRRTPGASLGDAILAGIGTGLVPDLETAREWVPPGTTYSPDLTRSQAYDALYRNYLDLYPATRDIVHRLARLAEEGFRDN